MTVNVPDHATAREPGPRPRRRRQGPSPWEGERVRSLTRGQVEDRWQDLGELYAQTSGGEPCAWSQATDGFLRRLTVDVRRPGFGLVVAEGTDEITGCAYGFSVRGDGPWWQGLDEYLPDSLLSVAEAGRLFAVSEILVPARVRVQDLDRDWNLARRLQKRLLSDHAAALGVMLVERSDVKGLEVLRGWGWRYLAVGSGSGGSGGRDGSGGSGGGDGGVLAYAPCRVLVLAP